MSGGILYTVQVFINREKVTKTSKMSSLLKGLSLVKGLPLIKRVVFTAKKEKIFNKKCCLYQKGVYLLFIMVVFT